MVELKNHEMRTRQSGPTKTRSSTTSEGRVALLENCMRVNAMSPPRLFGRPYHWTKGDAPPGEVDVFDASGKNLSDLFLINSADDTTPQWPDGVPGTVVLLVTAEGEPIPNGTPPLDSPGS